MTLHDKTNKQNFLLLIQLRWIAVGGQIVTILFVRYALGIGLPLVPMAVVILLLIALNVASLRRHSSQDAITNTELFLGLLLDVTALTVQLYLSGGASNPFISLYLLQVILGAVLLETWSVWALVLIASTCFIALTTFYREISLPAAHGAGLFSLHIQGMFICFVLAATLLVLFITRVQNNIRTRDAHLADLRQQSAEEAHIVRMGLLASGAAHELGTPLATLSVILNDWQRMPVLEADPDLAQEIREMQGQLDRCKKIVSGILMSSGELRGEGTVRTSVDAFLAELVAEWKSTRLPQGFEYTRRFGANQEIVSDPALKQVMFNVLDNALEASPLWVGLIVSRHANDLIIEVVDAGRGFEETMLAEFGKPYTSTKNRPGSGLGLFLVVNVIRKLGGSVTVRNRTEGGASVTLHLPLAALSPRGHNAD